MSLRTLPEQELDHNADYARWEFETMRAEWETHTCEHLTTRIASCFASDAYEQYPVRVVSCRDCGKIMRVLVN